MTFKIFALEMENFKCYRGTHGFEFPQEAGLYYLTGKNLFNKRLGANGCGKTSIIDAIEWAIYGKTSRGLRAGDVVSWGEKSCTVSVSLLVGEDEVEIVRTQNPNSIKANGKPASQEEITALIRLNQDAFNASIVLPQFGQSFFDLSPAEKLTMFSQVMDLDYWLEKSKDAAAEALKLESRANRQQDDIARAEGKLESYRFDVKDMKANLVNFDKKVKQQVAALEQEKADLAKSISPLAKKIRKLDKRMATTKKEHDVVVEAANDCALEFGKVNQGFYDQHAIVKDGKRRIENLKADALSLSELGEVCPTCRQEIDPEHVESHEAKVNKQVKKINKEIDAATAEIDLVSKKLEELRGDTFQLKKLMDDLSANYTNMKEERRNAQRSIEQVEAHLKVCDSAIAKAAAQVNPYEEMIATKQRQIRDTKRDIAAFTELLNAVREKHEAVDYWVGGFKRVRLFIIEEALTGLELEVNNLLVTLGLSEWRVTFDVERENKSGGVTKGFSVFIHSPKHTEPVRFESWSGGETQRLRLAGDLGLANLIMEQAGFINHIELIDEPSEHMSPEGIEDMVETIYQRAINTGKQIWLVDHNTMGFGEFAGVLTSIMDEAGQTTLSYNGG